MKMYGGEREKKRNRNRDTVNNKQTNNKKKDEREQCEGSKGIQVNKTR